RAPVEPKLRMMPYPQATAQSPGESYFREHGLQIRVLSVEILPRIPAVHVRILPAVQLEVLLPFVGCAEPHHRPIPPDDLGWRYAGWRHHQPEIIHDRVDAQLPERRNRGQRATEALRRGYRQEAHGTGIEVRQ